MNYNFTDTVRNVLATARDEAIRLRHDYVAPEHILIALVRQRDGLAIRVLAGLGATADEIRNAAEESAGPGHARAVAGELPYTSTAKRVLKHSMAAARRLSHSYVGTEHVLLGLLADDTMRSATVLRQFGVTLAVVEPEVARIGGAARYEPRTTKPGESSRDEPRMARRDGSSQSVWFLELDTASATPIYEQIVARVEEAVATGRLAEGERMPTVRDLAEELSIAPGTVARAYSDLESRGVLETAGARGTRVANRKKSAAAVPAAELEGLLKPVVVAAFHLGASAKQLRGALDAAMKGILSGLL